MPEKLIISISGMRGIVGENLTPSVAADYGCAFGTFLKRTCSEAHGGLTVCIGRDSRRSGPALAAAMTAGLCACGINVIDLGLVPTPSTSIMATELGCAGAVVITASHNPIQYNGIKLLLSDGMAPPAPKAQKIKTLFEAKDFELVNSPSCGTTCLNLQTYETHIAKVLKIIEAQRIAAKKFRVVLDSVNGAGCAITKRLLAELGCETIATNDEPSGLFAHAPEPTAQNVTELCEVVAAKKADVGFAQDPDADRLAIVDQDGVYIGEEYTLALAAKHVLSKTPGPVATNLSTSRMIDDIAAAAGANVIRTPVGEANVAGAMLQHKCVIGGEGNGGIIDLRVCPVRDSLVAIGLVLELMAQTGKTISQLVSEIPAYTMTKDKFGADTEQAEAILDAAKKRFARAKLDTSDGCRFDFEDGWVHLRSSNTEPVMRLIVEAKNEETAKGYAAAVSDIRRKIIGR